MGKHFGLVAFTGIIIGGSMAIFTFGDFLLATFSPSKIHAQENPDIVVKVIENPETPNYIKEVVVKTNRAEVTIPQEDFSLVAIPETDPNCPTPTHDKDLDLEPLSRTHSLGEAYAPRGLIRVHGDWGSYCIKSEVKEKLIKMMSSAEKEGLSIQVYSVYRSIDRQSYLFENWKQRNPGDVPYPAVAEPGHSEHHLGTTVDLKSGSIPYGTSNPFGSSQEYIWMVENAHKYGFVQSYQDGKQELTGYISEPWHWRYLGIEAATEIKNRGITINEYLIKV